MPALQSKLNWALPCLFLLAVQLFACFNVLAQHASYLPYHLQDTNRIEAVAQTHRQSLKEALVAPDGVSKKYKKHLEDITEGMSANIYRTLRYRALLDTVIDPYAQRVFRQILESNKHLPPARLVVVRSPIENAYAIGDGTILLNIGLLSKLENESQLAFVLSHELAHIYFKHMQKGLKEHLDLVHDKDLQKEIKKIVKQEYNMYARISSLVQNASLNKLYHKRTYEQQSDSMGYVLLYNAGFDAGQAYTALKLLDKIDEPYSTKEIDFSRYFGCQETYRLFDSKPKKAASIFMVEEAAPPAFALSDTLKSHPDCQKRMLYIQNMAKGQPARPVKTVGSQAHFEYIKAISRLEVIQSWYDGGRYDRALFETLLHLETHPEHAYLRAMAMLCLYELKEHMQAHRYYDVVSRRAEYYPANLNQLLDLLHSLNLSDFAGLGTCLESLYPGSGPQHEYKLASSYAYHVLIKDEATAEKLKKLYQEQYKQGRLHNSLFE